MSRGHLERSANCLKPTSTPVGVMYCIWGKHHYSGKIESTQNIGLIFEATVIRPSRWNYPAICAGDPGQKLQCGLVFGYWQVVEIGIATIHKRTNTVGLKMVDQLSVFSLIETKVHVSG